MVIFPNTDTVVPGTAQIQRAASNLHVTGLLLLLRRYKRYGSGLRGTRVTDSSNYRQIVLSS